MTIKLLRTGSIEKIALLNKFFLFFSRNFCTFKKTCNNIYLHHNFAIVTVSYHDGRTTLLILPYLSIFYPINVVLSWLIYLSVPLSNDHPIIL